VRNVLVVDVAIAVVLAAIVFIVSPGIAVTGLIALAVLVVLGISYGWSLRRR
jgi:ABC-type bacteriocin/lantibiotic exporter with double-glycine peptidase domain